MSYERQTFTELHLPSREKVTDVLLSVLLNNRGTIKEFGSGAQDVTDKIADDLGLTDEQRSFRMQTFVRKDSRLKTFPAWNRLLFRAADNAARLGLITRPTRTLKLTGRREWMLTEKGIDAALRITGKRIPKEELPVSTYEVERVKKQIEAAKCPSNYIPIDLKKNSKILKRNSVLRYRGFRLAIVDSYEYRCCICGLVLPSPDFLTWEVEAAHIVPHSYLGRDDIWNGIALCHLHHWAFDRGWFTLNRDFTIETSKMIQRLSNDQGKIEEFDLFANTLKSGRKIHLPSNKGHYPHEKSIEGHHANVFVGG